jgi:ATP-binding cassette subfamily B protein
MQKYYSQNKKIINFILDSIKPFKKHIFIHLLVITFTAINISLMPLVFKILLNKIISSQDLNILYESRFILIILTLSIILPSIFNRISDHVWTKFLPQLRHRITHNSLSKLFNQSHNFFQNHFSGSIVNKVRDLFNSTPKIIEIFLYNFLGGAMAIFIAFFTMSTINFFFAFALLTWIAIIIPLAYKSAVLTNRISMNVSNQQAKIMGNIVDVFANIQNIKLFSSANYEIARADKLQKKYSKLYQQRGLYLNKFYTVLSLISSCYFIICFVVLVSLFSHHKVTIGDFILILGINNFLHNIIQDFMRQIRNFLEEFSVINEAMHDIYQDIKFKNFDNKLSIKKGEIIFENVKFSYHQKNPLFSDKSIVIKAGQKVGLVGHSGSGKSTFINLLLRFYDVHEGRILIDGQDISKVSQDSLHEAIGVIPQEAILFHRNLIENISYGNKDNLSKEQLLAKVIDCSRKASAEKFIMKMPETYYSLVGERGVKLSGGQRQRIAIARAFFKNAPILILDEATSQLNSVTENIIQNSLKTLMDNKTTLVIAHRLSTLQMMDRIIVFDKGKIVEDGTHQELIELNGYYNKLWSAQSEGVLTYQIEGASAQQLFSPTNN